MRNLAAILLCGIFFFNWVGYRFLNNIMEEDAARRLDARLDRQQYDEDQLITVKVPLTDLAYYNNSARFERSSGQMEINGIPFRYVERRIYNDTLELKCIADQGTLKLRQSGNNFFNGANSLSFLSDPYIGIHPIRVDAPECAAVIPKTVRTEKLVLLSLPADERPPAA